MSPAPELPPLHVLSLDPAIGRKIVDVHIWAVREGLRGVGIDDADVTHGPVLNRASMVIDAAINGQGIALARTTLAAWDLINGRLVLAFPESVPVSKTYWIVCPKATATT